MLDMAKSKGGGGKSRCGSRPSTRQTSPQKQAGSLAAVEAIILRQSPAGVSHLQKVNKL